MNVKRFRELLAQLPQEARVEPYNLSVTGFLIQDEESGGQWVIGLPWRDEENQDGWIRTTIKPTR